MIYFAKYDLESGRIIESGAASEMVHVLAQADEVHAQLITGQLADDAREMVVAGAIVARPMLLPAEMDLIANGEDVLVLQVPAGTELFCPRRVVTDGSEIALSTVDPEDFSIKIVPPFPYAEQTVRVNVYEA